MKNWTYFWGVDRLISDVQQPLYDGRWKVAETNKFPKIFIWQFLPIFICCFVFQVGKKWFRKPAHACVLFCKRQLNEWHNFKVEHFINEFKCWVWASSKISRTHSNTDKDNHYFCSSLTRYHTHSVTWNTHTNKHQPCSFQYQNCPNDFAWGFSCSALLCTVGVIAHLLFAFLSTFLQAKCTTQFNLKF